MILKKLTERSLKFLKIVELLRYRNEHDFLQNIIFYQLHKINLINSLKSKAEFRNEQYNTFCIITKFLKIDFFQLFQMESVFDQNVVKFPAQS